jgi:hypothetical protein
VFEAVSLDSQRVTTSLVQVPGWQWRVAVSVPFTEFEARIHRSMMPLALVGVAFLVMALLAADRMSRRITEQVGWVLATSRSTERGEDPPRHTVTISELADLEHSLRSVGAREHEAQSQLTDPVLQNERVAAEFGQAHAARLPACRDAQCSWSASRGCMRHWVPDPGAVSRCCSSISTGSRRSTTGSGTSRAIACSSARPGFCGR